MAKGMKGTAHANKMMPNMSTYGGQENAGYHPPTGNAGPAAKGVYGHKSNPMSIPMKGSQIKDSYGNSDTMKAQKNKDEQLAKENLRGQPC